MVVIISRNFGETIQSIATGILIRRRKHHMKPETEGEAYLMTEAEIGVMKLQAKDHQRLMATTKSQEEVRKDISRVSDGA